MTASCWETQRLINISVLQNKRWARRNGALPTLRESKPSEQQQNQQNNDDQTEAAAAVISGAVERPAANTAKAAE